MPEEKAPNPQREVVESLNHDNPGSFTVFTEFKPKGLSNVFAARVTSETAVVTDKAGAFNATKGMMICVDGDGRAAMCTQQEFVAMFEPVVEPDEPEPEKKKTGKKSGGKKKDK